ncbi:MAG TPA: LytTR family DNA-binding domain-containing protein, partial [Methanosarcina sp.]|nr:LytTR family DNA-binding domain-containing protein [Methanosarcina sp.]
NIWNMNKISCIIIDDERSALETFQEVINRYLSNRVEVLGTAESVKDGAELIKSHHPDIVFLDIEMPQESGFKLFDYFTSFSFEVIFTTAYKQYAIDAIKYAALDYLLKPIDFMDLRDALARYEKRKKSDTHQQRIETLISNLAAGSDISQKVAFPTIYGYEMEKLNDIVYCEGDVNYTRVHIVGKPVIMVSRTLKEVEELLSSQHFFRIHKSFLVNLNFVKCYTRSENAIQLDNGEWLRVSTRKNDGFLRILTQWRNQPYNR